MKDSYLHKAIYWLILGVLLASCQKQDSAPDYRDRFCGTWQGTFTYSVPGLPGWTGSRVNHAYITKGLDPDELLIKSLSISYYAIARLQNNQYTYSPFEIGSSACETTELVRYSGSGSLAGNRIIESGEMLVSINGTEYAGTWKTIMTK